MGIGVEIMATGAYTSQELTWSNISEEDIAGHISMFSVIVILLFDAAWMYAAAAYIDNVLPGEFGTSESLLFPIYHLFPFLNREKGEGESASIVPLLSGGMSDTAVRQPYSNGTYGIEVTGLSKIYPPRAAGSSPFQAVDNLTLKMRDGEVAALLGQNGAGKSTTMNMLCTCWGLRSCDRFPAVGCTHSDVVSIAGGLFGATAGEMLMGGHDIQTSDGRAFRRRHLGVCPQHDVLWKMLTVWEVSRWLLCRSHACSCFVPP